MENIVNLPNNSPRSTRAVSVVIPMYNVEKYVGECLDSLLAQTFQDFDIIVVDDCSTDKSLEIVKSYEPKFKGRLTISRTEKNSDSREGLTRNVGVELSKGEYIFFLDADDYLLDSALETLYNAAKEYDAEVVYSGSYYKVTKPNDISYIHRDGVGIKLFKENLEDKTDLTVDDPNKLLRILLTEGGNFANVWTKLCRRDFLIKNNIDFSQAKFSSDFIWVINVYCHAKRFLRISTPFYFYRSYNTKSISNLKSTSSSEQISRWLSAFVTWSRCLKELENKTDILRENPAYCLAASKSHFGWCLSRIRADMDKLSDKEIYEILSREFNKRNDLSESMMPFFMSLISADRKARKEDTKTIDNLKKDLEQLKKLSMLPSPVENKIAQKNISTCPIVSVIIPLYNAEKYIAECLDSLLAQTFQDFEVIVVDDCSTDNGVKIVESYVEKFGGRLTLASMEKNSGSGGLPRNKGIILSRGEYIKFVDSDDTLTKTALEELYTLAKNYNADVVYCEKYFMSSGVDEEFIKNVHTADRLIQPAPFVDKPTLETEDLSERVKKILSGRFWVATCNKFVKRNLLIKNEIFFPQIIPAEDDIWTYGLIFFAKKFLRVPNMIYIRRMREDSVMRLERSPQDTIKFWLNPLLLGLKSLDNLMSKHEFFKINPQQRYAILEMFVNSRLNLSFSNAGQLSATEIYATIKDEFGDRLGDYDVLIPALCTALFKDKQALSNDSQIINKFSRYFTARLDIKLMSTAGDFQILSMSDKTAAVWKPAWFQKGGIGYQIQSYAGKLDIVTKVTADGKINFFLRGIWVPVPEDNTKRIPYWIDYTKFMINDKTIFDKLTPVWHDEPYRYNIEVKAGEEIKIQVEWLPHRSDILPAIPKPEIPKLEIPKPVEKSLVDKFLPYVTSRVDVKLVPKIAGGDFQILSMSDKTADIQKPAWLQKNGIGYQIQSYAGKLDIITKVTADGKINLNLLGLNVPDPNDKSKRIPYWIDYTKLTVNGKTIFDKLTPAWHDEFYPYNMEVKAGEEIKIQVEWLPHRGDILPAIPKPEIPKLEIPKPEVPKPEIPKPVEKSLVDKFLPYVTGRVDLQLVPKIAGGDFQILSMSDKTADVRKPAWFQKGGIGYQIQSYAGKIEFIAKSTADGKINLNLRGLDVPDPNDKSKRIPYWIDYTKLTVNGKTIIDKLTSAWHDKPYRYSMDVKAGEEIKIQVEWLPHRGDT